MNLDGEPHSVAKSSTGEQGDDQGMSRLQDYASAGFAADLLPIIPPDAAIGSGSLRPEQLVLNRGKVPGHKRHDGWVGFGSWAAYQSTDEDISRWSAWDCGAGLQGRRFPGLDADVEHEQLADLIETEAQLALGLAPTRFGRGSRRLLVYAAGGGAPIRKRRLAFRLHGRGGPAADPAAAVGGEAGDGAGGGGLLGSDHALELLGVGQQYVVEGVHPKTGKPYWWRDGTSPAEIGAAGLTPITDEELDAFFENIAWVVENLFDGDILTDGAAAGGGGDRADTDQGGLLAPTLAAIEEALAAVENDVDYDTWIKVCAAVKAASGGDEAGYEMFEAWSLGWPGNDPEMCRAKWDSLHAPFAVGWGWLSAWAGESGFNGAAYEFSPVETTSEDDAMAVRAKEGAQLAFDMFDRCVWIEKLAMVGDLRTREMLDRTQLNARYWRVGEPSSSKDCAWAVFMRNGAKRRNVASVTYRPGGAVVYDEGEHGLCMNTWRAPQRALPESVSDADAQPWLDHMAYLIPQDAERETFLNWQAWVVQNPAMKPNWGVLLGSAVHGNGKSISLAPMRYALGDNNVRPIGPSEVASGYTGWVAETKLFVVEEMHTYERKETMNRLKNLLASPPERLQVNPKFGKQYEIPNILTGVFFTNHADALALERGDRRFYVIWTEVAARSERYYEGLVAWLRAGGAAAAARWLLQRDVSGFNAQGNAPDTAAKEDMRRHSRGEVEEWIEDGITDGAAPFDTDLISLAEVWAAAPAPERGARVTKQRVSSMLRRAGAKSLGQFRMGSVSTGATGGDDRVSLLSVRRHEMYAREPVERLRELFILQRAKRLSREGIG